MKRPAFSAFGAVVIALVLISCTPMSLPVSGVVESVEVRQSVPASMNYSAYEAWKEPHFVAITVVAIDGIQHRAALPVDLSAAHGIHPGDAIVVTLGRTAFRTIVPEHIFKEKDGTVRVRESTKLGWRLIETYKFTPEAVPGVPLGTEG